MTLTSTFTLFIAMLVVAIIPGPGVFAVVSRSMASGFFHGVVTAMGIVCGDYVFIILSIYGLSTVAQSMGELFILVRYCGAAYLCWLGITLLRNSTRSIEVQSIKELSWSSNFFAGFLTTLANPKAILFYASLFPAFVDVTSVTMLDLAIVMFVITIAVVGVMVAYAYLTTRASQLFHSAKANKIVNMTAGSVMLGCGLLLALRKT
jgi:threonine/homoserine/homoserine lactone efflux protein